MVCVTESFSSSFNGIATGTYEQQVLNFNVYVTDTSQVINISLTATPGNTFNLYINGVYTATLSNGQSYQFYPTSTKFTITLKWVIVPFTVTTGVQGTLAVCGSAVQLQAPTKFFTPLTIVLIILAIIGVIAAVMVLRKKGQGG